VNPLLTQRFATWSQRILDSVDGNLPQMRMFSV